MSAINVIVSVIAAFSVLVSLILVVVLPLTSTIIAITCEEKYFPIYAFATIGLSLVATIWNMDVTLFYVVPSIVAGFIFGFCIKRSIYFGWSIVISSILQTGISFAIIPLMNLIFGLDFIQDLQVIFKFQSGIAGNIFICVFFYVVSLIQTFLSFVVVSNEIEKINHEYSSNRGYLVFTIFGSVCSLLVIPMAFIFVPASYVFELVAFAISGFVIYEFFKNKNKWLLITSGLVILINIFLVAILYPIIPAYCGLMVFSLTPLIICLLSFCYFLLKKEHNKIK